VRSIALFALILGLNVVTFVKPSAAFEKPAAYNVKPTEIDREQQERERIRQEQNWFKAALLDAACACNSPNNPITDGLKKLDGVSFQNLSGVKRITEPGELQIDADVADAKGKKKGSIHIEINYDQRARPRVVVNGCELKVTDSSSSADQKDK